MSITRSAVDVFRYGRVVRKQGAVIASSTALLDCPSTTTGEKVNDYKQKISEGVNASSNYTADRTKVVKDSPGSYSGSGTNFYGPIYTTQTHQITGYPMTCYLPSITSSVSASKAKAIALQKIYNKIREEQQHMNSLASLAEFGDVVRQFGAPAAALVDLSNRRLNRLALERRGLKGSTVFKRIQWHKIVASTWLEYAFGLAPLISDTRKAAEALARWEYETTGSAKFRSRIKARGEDIARTISQGSTSAYGSTYIVGHSVTKDEHIARHQYVCGLKTTHTADFGSNERLLQLLGVTPENLIPAAWEAIPWSWLVDYFANVQSILTAAATSTASVAWVCETISSEHSREQQWLIDSAATTALWKAYGMNGGASGVPAHFKSVRKLVQRNATAVLSVPPLTFTLPSEVGKLANMTAVLFSKRAKSSALWLF